jgi:zona occludens toxin
MIYLITGVPGSGKTLYAVSTLMQKLAAELVPTADGSFIPRRLVVDGIPNLALDHAVMAESTVSEKGEISTAGSGLANWHEWSLPGDVIVVDEVQRYLRPRALGVRPPACIKELETHRHKGVDFIFITQRPGLIDQNIRQLVGRHQHVRRLFGSNQAVIYDWDGCQADTHRVAGATKSFFRFPRKAFQLYKSAEVHTKQNQKIPAWLILPVLAVIGGVFLFPMAFRAVHGEKQAFASTPKTDAKAVSHAAGPAGPLVVPAASPSSLPPGASVATSAPSSPQEPVFPLPDEVPLKRVAGCIHLRDRCECFDERALRVKVPDGFCAVSAYRVGQLVAVQGGNVPLRRGGDSFVDSMPKDHSVSAADLEMLRASRPKPNPQQPRIALADVTASYRR